MCCRHSSALPASNKPTPASGGRILFCSSAVADERALSDVVITKIHQVEGVEETDTHIVADA